jgi:broad specificity polyphosphatase/5'/3'-nucleotidase SurE
MGYKEAEPPREEPSDSDVFVIRNKRLVSVTPITLDMTSKVDFSELDRHFKS